MESLLSPLVSSLTRVRILTRFFSNPDSSSYLRELAGDFSISPNAVREELQRLSKAKLLTSFKKGREVRYRANAKHPLFGELVSIVQKVLGIDQLLDNIIAQLGDIKLALLVGDYAIGKDTGLVDLVLVGSIDQAKLSELVTKTEGFINRKIRTLALSPEEYNDLAKELLKKNHLVLWRDPSYEEVVVGN